ncbi:MAG: phytanoyl-CoA dioxygenase family protein [Lentisphaerae bacterium]|nr:phytanoyl-CoA dioxygenase family protein [Lentisphaerota bacterium]
MSMDQVVSPMVLTANERRFYREEGYLCLPGFVESRHLEALRAEVLAILAAKGMDLQRLGQATDTADKLRQYSAYLRGSHLDRLINGSRALAVAAQLLGGAAIRYLPFTAVKLGGGGGTFHFHQDNNYTTHDPALGSINIWVALVDMTPENGCLLVVPRSHLGGTLEAVNAGDGDGHRKVSADPEYYLPIRMRAGDAVAFTRLTVHGSGPNQTPEPRLAYALQYHRDDVKYRDPASGEWKLLITNPRTQTPPQDAL